MKIGHLLSNGLKQPFQAIILFCLISIKPD